MDFLVPFYYRPSSMARADYATIPRTGCWSGYWYLHCVRVLRSLHQLELKVSPGLLDCVGGTSFR